MVTINGMRVIESVWLTESGQPCDAWVPCGGGWKKRLTVVPQVPYRGAIQIDANTIAMHPDTLRAVKGAW